MTNKILLFIVAIIWIFLIWASVYPILENDFIWNNIISSESSCESPLPAQEKSEWLRWLYDIDKNINEKTIDNYLNRSDVVYRDVRMLEDSATWENKWWTRNMEWFVAWFEVIPYAYLTQFPQAYINQKAEENVSGLYQWRTLFSLDSEWNYIANYEESLEILEFLFPKDKYIFIMCGAGGYANFTKQMLVALWWDSSKIYNVWWYRNYEWSNWINTVNKNGDTVTYDFWKVPYHDINFDSLTAIN